MSCTAIYVKHNHFIQSYVETLRSKEVKQVTQPTTGSHDEKLPEPFNLKAILSPLPVSLAANANNLCFNVAVDQRTKYVDVYIHI